MGLEDVYGRRGEREARSGPWGEGDVDMGRLWRAWPRLEERERRWRGLGAEDAYGRRGERKAGCCSQGDDGGVRGGAWGSGSGRSGVLVGCGGALGSGSGRSEPLRRGGAAGGLERQGWVCHVGGERERRRLRDQASSWGAPAQWGGVRGSWGASRGAAWYEGGGGVLHPPLICRVGVWRRWRLVVRVE